MYIWVCLFGSIDPKLLITKTGDAGCMKERDEPVNVGPACWPVINQSDEINAFSLKQGMLKSMQRGAP